MEELQQLTEDFNERAEKPGSRPGSLKRKAAMYLGKGAGDKLSKTDLKRLRAKANKMKKSTKKAERDFCDMWSRIPVCRCRPDGRFVSRNHEW